MVICKARCILLTVLTLFINHFSTVLTIADPGRTTLDLSGPGWQLWLDQDTEWRNDTVYLPPVSLDTIPDNAPSCGWERLRSVEGINVSVPGTVEQHFWGSNGNPLGIAGDYRGVSWWSRKFPVEEEWDGKRLTLIFESVNLRAEIFVNRKLVGYDVIGNTPFSVNITNAVRYGESNSLDIRITDPVGNFTWEDNDLCHWGPNLVPAVHGFGGITGRIALNITDAVSIEDVYVENTPNITEVTIFSTFINNTSTTKSGKIAVTVHEWQHPERILWSTVQKTAISPPGDVIPIVVSAPEAIPWGIRDPHLYVAKVQWNSDDGTIADTSERRFGFRWFDVKMTDGDRRFYLNGKRVFLFCAMTRGFWPKNGMFPTPEMARRDVNMCMDLGFNTMLFHRAVGQHYVTELCDEAGLLVYEEPGGYRCAPEPGEKERAWRREKLRRMVFRDRSYPSLVIYNLKNEARRPPSDDDIANIRMVHDLDPGRIVTYNSDRNRDPGVTDTTNIVNDPYMLHLLPGDHELRYDWFDHHHWFRYAGYVDSIYNNPRFYMRGQIAYRDSINTLDPNKIIFWGEEGQWGTMMRLEKIRNEIIRNSATGFREQEHLIWYDYYDRFLDETGFRNFFPTVDDLTLSMGRSLHYFHGRVLENVRISNLGDGYNLNGWAAPVTSEDIVDVYRYPTADTSILKKYSRPLYLAVKIRDKVLSTGMSPIADIFIVNEKDLHGVYTLDIRFTDPDGAILFSDNQEVSVKGGETFGELLTEGIIFPPVEKAGYYNIEATLSDTNGIHADGNDNVFVVDLYNGPGIKGRGTVIDTTGVINCFLQKTRGITLPEFDPEAPEPDYIIIGPHDFREISSNYRGSRYINPVLNCVANGTTVIILDQAELWARDVLDNLFRHPAVEFKRMVNWGTDGRFIAGCDSILTNLPQAQAMGWEYQVFYMGDVRGLDIERAGSEHIVCLACENRKDIVSALTRTPYGTGAIYLTTLNITREINSTQSTISSSKTIAAELARIWCK